MPLYKGKERKEGRQVDGSGQRDGQDGKKGMVGERMSRTEKVEWGPQWQY